MDNSPIVLFVYNRPWHTKQTVEALMKNNGASESPLYIYSDAARNESTNDSVEEVRSYIREISGFKTITIVERAENFGLANSIIDGVSYLTEKYGRVIVLEDDLVTSPFFLNYMNNALEHYKDDSRVMSISAFSRNEVFDNIHDLEPYDTFFVQRNSSWGWGTWKDSWVLADWEVASYEGFSKNKNERKKFAEIGEDLNLMLDLQQNNFIDSWSIRWTYTHYLNNGVSLIPYQSYVENIGFDGSGTHCRSSNRISINLSKAKEMPSFPDTVKIRKDTLLAFKTFERLRLISRVYWKTRLFARRLGFFYT